MSLQLEVRSLFLSSCGKVSVKYGQRVASASRCLVSNQYQKIWSCCENAKWYVLPLHNFTTLSILEIMFQRKLKGSCCFFISIRLNMQICSVQTHLLPVYFFFSPSIQFLLLKDNTFFKVMFRHKSDSNVRCESSVKVVHLESLCIKSAAFPIQKAMQKSCMWT